MQRDQGNSGDIPCDDKDIYRRLAYLSTRITTWREIEDKLYGIINYNSLNNLKHCPCIIPYRSCTIKSN